MQNNEGRIQIAHGGGGLLSSQLIREEILSRFGSDKLRELPDAASLQVSSKNLLFATDSFVVYPIEFHGGNIGDLAVHGTINDLSVAGAKPLYLSMGLILEEGLSLNLLRRVLDSIQRCTANCGIELVTGDTKVVRRGQCDKIYINTSGIGEKLPDFDLGIEKIKVGDKVVLSGTIADHGSAILAARESINFDSDIRSDTASVFPLVEKAHNVGVAIRFMRDPTRGGLASVLSEIVENQTFGITIHEERLPLSHSTKAITELLGLDVLHIASEGRMLAICAGDRAEELLSSWRKLPEGEGAEIVGEVSSSASKLILKTVMGTDRLVRPPLGELLPRIC